MQTRRHSRPSASAAPRADAAVIAHDTCDTYAVDDLIERNDELKGGVQNAVLARALACVGNNLRHQLQRVQIRDNVAPLIRDAITIFSNAIASKTERGTPSLYEG